MTVKIGLALSGGGAKGLAHIGVLKVLEEAQIPVHMLAGTSMGGAVAALYAAGLSAAEIEQFARSLRLLDIVQRDRSYTGLIGNDKIANRLREALGDDLTFDRLKLPLALVATDLEAGEEVVIREGPVIEAVLATMAVPIIFPPVEWQERLLVDGGLLNQVPFDVVRQMGAQAGTPIRVIAVHTLPAFPDKLGDETPCDRHGPESIVHLLIRRSRWAPMIEVAERSYNVIHRRQVEQLMKQSPPDLMIEIALRDVGLLDLDQVDACIKAGEQAAHQHLDELIELRDAPPPGRLARWWRTITNRLAIPNDH
ncbi:MAG: patatin-like phospholipase family protein [Anaerolineae bacterium]|nr:patatin-like phospholipase family protein [Anaerolineae bacterium]